MVFDRKLISELDGKLVGLRIKSCRVLTGFNQDEFSSNHGVALPSLKSWELGVIPRREGILRLIEAFKNDGVFVNLQWLLFGHGTGPAFNLGPIDADNTDDSLWHAFKKECVVSRDNPIVSIVADDEMDPFFTKGEMVFGKLIDAQLLIDDINKRESGKPLLVCLAQDRYEPRWVHVVDGKFFSRSVKTSALRAIDSLSFAKICWHQMA
ncbi:hypothetical protein E6Q11_03755 [Candidatus Dojkabacteria bacterium]|uniref:Uncharacterized protein n=1 Tax=Candidatus Dojkabacteria bacterium TaxID=2099670 RepID=A0A5C7J5Y2_9BACT|nr:MAG: hypothetical protein E6Q11_03755 [Candidatus Dojkabacteria bacterium]